MRELWQEITRLQAALVEYDKALQWHECPWRDEIERHRDWDRAILADMTQQACGGWRPAPRLS